MSDLRQFTVEVRPGRNGVYHVFIRGRAVAVCGDLDGAHAIAKKLRDKHDAEAGGNRAVDSESEISSLIPHPSSLHQKRGCKR